jgi:hypothetical protein
MMPATRPDPAAPDFPLPLDAPDRTARATRVPLRVDPPAPPPPPHTTCVTVIHELARGVAWDASLRPGILTQQKGRCDRHGDQPGPHLGREQQPDLPGRAGASILASITGWKTSQDAETAQRDGADRWGIFVGLRAATVIGLGNALAHHGCGATGSGSPRFPGCCCARSGVGSASATVWVTDHTVRIRYRPRRGARARENIRSAAVSGRFAPWKAAGLTRLLDLTRK